MPRNAAVTRDRILKAAHGQFFRRGFSRVSMTDIARAAKLTKRSLYHHFDSKDSLLEAMLDDQHALSAATFEQNFADVSGGPEALVQRLFDDLGRWAESGHYLGSGFTRLATELGDLRGHPAMRLARRHKAAVEALFADRLKQHGAGDPRGLAREIWILMEGAMIMLLLHRDAGYARTAAGAAQKLVHHAKAGAQTGTSQISG